MDFGDVGTVNSSAIDPCSNVSSNVSSTVAVSPDTGMPDDRVRTAGTVDATYEARVINQIAASMLDNIDEYRRAIFGLEQLLDTLQCRLYNRVQTLEQLQTHVSNLGAQPVTTRTALGAAFASLLSTPQLFSRTHQEDLMLDVDRGERAMKALFKQSLANKRLSGEGHDCINKAIDQLSVDRCRPADL